jgi:hypothetical protein
MSMKNSSDTIRNRTRDLPACTAVLQPTATQAAYPDFLWYAVEFLKTKDYKHSHYLSRILNYMFDDVRPLYRGFSTLMPTGILYPYPD